MKKMEGYFRVKRCGEETIHESDIVTIAIKEEYEIYNMLFEYASDILKLDDEKEYELISDFCFDEEAYELYIEDEGKCYLAQFKIIKEEYEEEEE